MPQFCPQKIIHVKDSHYFQMWHRALEHNRQYPTTPIGLTRTVLTRVARASMVVNKGIVFSVFFAVPLMPIILPTLLERRRLAMEQKYSELDGELH